MGSGAKSYMRKGFLILYMRRCTNISQYMKRPLVIYDCATDPSEFHYSVLAGFGRTCAPVRCAHPSFWVHCHTKRGAARPPAHRSFAASYSALKNIYIYLTWAAHVKGFFLSTGPQRL